MRMFEPRSAERVNLLREAMGVRRVLFLVSDSARHITGTTIVVDCGEILGAPAWSAQLGSQ